MKTFEEKWTAWLDGELTGQELAEFEAALPDKATADAEKRSARKLGVFLKEQLKPQAMGNEEFFHHQLRQRIAAEEVKGESPRQSRSRPVLWPIGRLVWAGITSLAVFSLFAFMVMKEKEPSDKSQYLTQILNARVDPAVSPGATISMFKSKEDKVTVLWVDGLESLPSDYAAK
jgi:hypothetical protein